MKPIVMDVNVETGEIVEREMTDEEYAVYLADQEAANAETL